MPQLGGDPRGGLGQQGTDPFPRRCRIHHGIGAGDVERRHQLVAVIVDAGGDGGGVIGAVQYPALTAVLLDQAQQLRQGTGRGRRLIVQPLVLVEGAQGLVVETAEQHPTQGSAGTGQAVPTGTFTVNRWLAMLR